MRWAVLLLAGCGRIAFDPQAASDASTDDTLAAIDTPPDTTGDANGFGQPPSFVSASSNEAMSAAGGGIPVSVQVGDAIVVVMSWGDVASNPPLITDAIGTVFNQTATVQRGTNQSLIIYVGFAPTTQVGETVNYQFGAATQKPSFRVLVYRGVHPTRAITQASGAGTFSTATSGFATLLYPNTRAVAADVAEVPTAGPGSAWTLRVTTAMFGNIVEDAIQTTTGSVRADAMLSGNGEFLMQVVALPPM